jgi:hypothetical protein
VTLAFEVDRLPAALRLALSVALRVALRVVLRFAMRVASRVAWERPFFHRALQFALQKREREPGRK